MSGEADRSDLVSHWRDLYPIVCVGLMRRIVVVGAESTGTTTLTEDLAERLGAPSVPEFLREYAEERAMEAGSIWDVTWTSSDFDEVAEGQDRLEAEVVSAWVSHGDRSPPASTGPLVLCDGDALATAIWHFRYVGTPSPRFLGRAAARPAVLYLLTSHEGVDFDQDGLRDGEHLRAEMTGWFREALREQQTPWIEVTGVRSKRVELALDAIARLTAEPRSR